MDGIYNSKFYDILKNIFLLIRISDSFLGKFKTITFGFILYLIGYAIYPILAQNDSYIPNYCMYKGNKSSIEPSIIINGSIIGDQPFMNENLFTESCSWLLFLADILIGFAVTLIKSNIAPFGAEQVSIGYDLLDTSLF